MTKTIFMDKPKALEPLRTRAEGIRKNLVNSHQAGRGSSNEVLGNEREQFISNYFRALYPPSIRVSSGEVMDSYGKKSGQLDIILEKPTSISFPLMPDSNQRLFLVDQVSAIISVKSNLHAQWKQFECEVEPLVQMKIESHAGIRFGSTPERLPVFLVAYSGAQDPKAIVDKLQANAALSIVNGIVVLDSNIFICKTESSWIFNSLEDPFLCFASELHRTIVSNSQVGETIWHYVCAVK